MNRGAFRLLSLVLVETFLWSTLSPDLFFYDSPSVRILRSPSRTHDLLRPKSSKQKRGVELQKALDGGDRVVPLDEHFERTLKERWEQIYEWGLQNQPDLQKRPIVYDPSKIPTKFLGPFQILLVKGKKDSLQWGSFPKTETGPVVEPVDPSVFNFTKTDPEQFLFEIKVGKSRYQLYPNKFPLFPHHVLLSVKELRPQVLTHEDIQNTISITHQTPLKLFFNSWRAGATINHFHLQGSFNDLPVSRLPVSFLAEVKGIRIGRLSDDPEANLVFEGKDMESLARLVYEFVDTLVQRNIPYNISFEKGKVIVVPRTNDPTKERAFQERKEKLQTTAYMGLAVVMDETSYKSLTQEAFEELVSLRSLPEERYFPLVDGFLYRLFSQKNGMKRLGELVDKSLEERSFYVENPMDVETLKKRGMVAIVLHGGRGRRMKSFKQLFPFLGRPMGIWPVRAFHEAGIPTVVAVGHRMKEVVEAFEKEIQGLMYVGDDPLYGVPHSVLLVLKALEGYEGPVLVVNGDAAAMDSDLAKRLEQALRQTKEDAILIGYEEENPKGLGRIVLRDGKVIRIVEESELQERKMIFIRGEAVDSQEIGKIRFVNAGFYGFKSAKDLRKILLDLYPFRTEPRAEYPITGPFAEGFSGELLTVPEEEAYKLIQPNDPATTLQLEARLRQERSLELNGYRGGFKSFLTFAQKDLREISKERHEIFRNWRLARTLRKNRVTIRGNLFDGSVYIGPEVDISNFKNGIIESGTRITGKKSKIGPSSHLSGHIVDSEIGNSVTILQGKEIINSVIGDGATVDRSSVLHSRIGKSALLVDSTVSRYVVEDRSRIMSATLEMKGESTFGNGIRLAIAPEVGGPEIPIYAEVPYDEIWDAVTQRHEPEILKRYERKVTQYTESRRSERGIVEEGAEIEESTVTNSHIGAYATIGKNVEIENATILSNHDERTTIKGVGTIVRDTIVQWGSEIYDGAKVYRSALLEHSHAGVGAPITDSVLAPNAVIERGEVTSYLAGPFLVSHHLGTILIAAVNAGRGNVGGGHVDSNQPARQADQRGFLGEGIYWGIHTIVSFPVNLAPFGIISMGLDLPRQKVHYPFFWIRSPRERPNGLPQDMHEIVPAGVLLFNPYLIVRMERKHEERNQARRTSFDLRIFKGEIIQQMIHARNILDNRYPDRSPKEKKEVYTEEDYPGLGYNFMTEGSRQRSIEAYTDYIRLYLIKELKGMLENILRSGDISSWEEVLMRFPSEENSSWKETEGLIEEEWGKTLSQWSKEDILSTLEKVIALQERHAHRTREVKEKDPEWEKRVFGVSFEDVGDDKVIQELEDQTKIFAEEVRILQEKIRHLGASRDGSDRRGRAIEELKNFLDERFLPYPPGDGIKPLKELIRQYELNLYGRSYSPDQIFVTAGTKISFENLLLSLLDPNDTQGKVWLSGKFPSDTLSRMVSNVATFGEGETLPQFENLEILLARLQSETKTLPKVIFVRQYPVERRGDVLEELLALAKKHNIVLVFDATTDDPLWESENEDPLEAVIRENPDYAKNVITFVDLSYRFTDLAGWGIGYLLVRNEELFKTLSSITSQTTTGTDLAVQKSVVGYLRELISGKSLKQLDPIPSIRGDLSLVSERGKSLKPSSILMAAAKAPPDALRFDVGQSSFGPSEEMIQGMLEAAFRTDLSIERLESLVLEGHHEYLSWSRNLLAKPSHTVIGLGTKALLFNTYRAIEHLSALKGKKMVVAIPPPYWVSYLEPLYLAGGEAVFPKTYSKDNYNVTVEALEETFKGYEGHQKVLILNSPSNPSGQIYTKEELIKIAKYAVENDIYVISDEIYGLLAFGEIPHVSIAFLEKEVPGIREKTILLTGLSKEEAAAGLRVGFATIWDPELLVAVRDVTLEGPDRIALGAAWGAYRNPEALRKHIGAHRQWLLERKVKLERTLDELGIPYIKHYGGIFLFADMRGIFGRSWKGQEITEENFYEVPDGIFYQGTQITGVPGGAFGMPGWIRFSFPVKKMETLDQALENLRNFVGALQMVQDGSGKRSPIVAALGGNALEKKTLDEQMASLKEMLEPVVELIRQGETVLMTHGNGPQVGALLLRAEEDAEKGSPLKSLPELVEETQKQIGAMIQLVLENLLHEKGIEKEIVIHLTRVVVDPEDPAFQNPTKFIGKGYSKEEAKRLAFDKGWVLKEDPPRGWRRVVPSPRPKEIVGLETIQEHLGKGKIVIAVGGGGVPVSEERFEGLDAVIDKDRASALLAKQLGVEQFVILTAVDQVALDFGKETERWLPTMTVEEAKRYYAEGQFPPGSMGPKIEAAIDFLENGGGEVIITDGAHLLEAFKGNAGTKIALSSKDGSERLAPAPFQAKVVERLHRASEATRQQAIEEFSFDVTRIQKEKVLIDLSGGEPDAVTEDEWADNLFVANKPDRAKEAFEAFQLWQVAYLKNQLERLGVQVEQGENRNQIRIPVSIFSLKVPSRETNPALLLRDRLFVKSGILARANPSTRILPTVVEIVRFPSAHDTTLFPNTKTHMATPYLELVIPQLVYSDEHLDYVASSVASLRWDGKKHIPIPRVPPYKLRVVQYRSLSGTPEEREALLEKVGWNIFKVSSGEVLIDLLSDSGTPAQSTEQWAGIVRGDESYAGSRSARRVRETIGKLWNVDPDRVIVVHQGRAAENNIFGILVKPGMVAIGNPFFDTTKANIQHRGGSVIDVSPFTSHDPTFIAPFKGDLDLQKLETTIQAHEGKIAFLMMTATNNNLGGQPVSLANMREVRKIADKYGLLLLLDAARISENAYFIWEREAGYSQKSVREILGEIGPLFDVILMSAKKDGLANMGGIIYAKDPLLYDKLFNEITRAEGLASSYGGMSGRDLEALAQGLEEASDEDYLRYRIGQVRYLGEKLKRLGVPIVEPVGGHGVYINAGLFADHIPSQEYPGKGVEAEIFIEGGIRTVEVGSYIEGVNLEGEEAGSYLELTRLAIPRRVLSKADVDYIAEVIGQVYARRKEIRGFEFLREQERVIPLRHFKISLKRKPLLVDGRTVKERVTQAFNSPLLEVNEPVKGLVHFDTKGSVIWVDSLLSRHPIPKGLFEKILLPKLQFEKLLIEKGLMVNMEDEWVREVMTLQPITYGIATLPRQDKVELKEWIEARLLESEREDLKTLKDLLAISDFVENPDMQKLFVKSWFYAAEFPPEAVSDGGMKRPFRLPTVVPTTNEFTPAERALLESGV